MPFMQSTFQVLKIRTTSLHPVVVSRERLLRCQSSLASSQQVTNQPTPEYITPNHSPPPLLSRIPTPHLLRSVFLGTLFTSPTLFKAGLAFLSSIANSKSSLLDPDRNLLLKGLIKPLVYNQFCAGVDAKEVGRTVDALKKMGYKGVILIYSKEIPAMSSGGANVLEEGKWDKDVESWFEGNMRTLEMVQKGDYMGIKFTGAGPRVAQALAQGKEPPKQFLEAIEKICDRVAEQGSRIWVDAEQQVFQPTIDAWTTQLMKKYNRKEALVSNTVQAYLKSTRANVTQLLKQAQEEGWTAGIKLVRGAYIASEKRDAIHDTKTGTDECYDGIAADLLKQDFPGVEKFPEVELFIAGHNADSIRKVYAQYKTLAAEDRVTRPVKFGQLLGMADDISCELLQLGEQEGEGQKSDGRKEAELMVYKCMNWGSVRECMHYLVRRAVENRSAVGRMEQSLGVMRQELWRRIF